MITEKTAIGSSERNCVVFEVHRDANKSEIAHAVEKIFEVKVKNVQTLNYRGKPKRGRQRIGRQASWKKAYVALEPGNEINMIEGL